MEKEKQMTTEVRTIENAEEKRRICRVILEALPEWFGIPEAREEYVSESADKLFFAAMDGENSVGFLCLKETGRDTVELRAESGFRGSYEVPDTPTVSTIGAGDNFNAGFIYGLVKHGITREQIEHGLSPEQWDRLIASAQDFSAECCKSLFNYVSKEFGEQKKL